jgi:hypothetical protein
MQVPVVKVPIFIGMVPVKNNEQEERKPSMSPPTLPNK